MLAWVRARSAVRVDDDLAQEMEAQSVWLDERASPAIAPR
jgi:hypothetical protein